MLRFAALRHGLLLLCVSFFANSTPAATLNVDSSKSQITLEGSLGGQTLREQGAGSLTTTIGGTIEVTTGGGQIEITGAALDPNVNGNWRPGRDNAATSPADLAGQATIFGLSAVGALRDLLLDAKSSPKPLDSQGQFDAASIVFSFPTNSNSTFDYDSFLTGKDSVSLASNGTNRTATVGTLVENNGVQTLTIALDAEFFFSLVVDNDTVLRLKGQLVASGAPGPSNPSIVGTELVDGQLTITVSGASETSQLEGSTNLVTWTPVPGTGTAGPNGTRIYTVPASDKFQFFRLKQ